MKSAVEAFPVINKKSERIKLIESMWKIAYADGNIDKYEEHIIRKVSNLIYVAHSDFIKAKINAKESNENI